MEYFKPQSYLSVPTQDICSWLFDRASYNPDKPVYIDAHDPSFCISWNQAARMVRQLIAGLRAAGFKKGDCLNLHSFNDIHYSIIVLATIGAGGVFTGSNPSSSEEELKHHIETSDSNWLVTQPEVMDSLVKAADAAGLSRSRIVVFDTRSSQSVPKGFASWRRLLDHGETDWDRFNDFERSKNTTAARLFSSGTTGLPKAVSISHRNLIAQHVSTMEEYRPDYMRRLLIAVPCFHAAAFPATHISALKTGDATYIMSHFDLKAYVQAHLKYEITEMVTLPPIVMMILNSPLANTKFFQKVRRGICGAASMDKDTQERFRALLAPDATYTQVWGMTETTTLITGFAPWEHDSTGSVGCQLSSVEIKLVDADGTTTTAYNRPGEILVRGPAVSQGYHNNTRATANDFSRDGWFHTGDIGYCDEETKKWYIIDRKKDIIKMRGMQIAPVELEAALLSHPEIADCAVIGVKLSSSLVGNGASSTTIGDESEYPRAYIIRRPGSRLTEIDVHKFMGERLTRSKQLAGGIKFVPAIPKSPSGKILKRVLRKQAMREIEKEVQAQGLRSVRAKL
ncbi:hypothetical protein KEM56_000949 [Ascosphaera pollenicola]|nr:hypothetical protein KEM56_000949 [Ascosphaera pollenicola]